MKVRLAAMSAIVFGDPLGLGLHNRALWLALAAVLIVTFWARVYIGDHWLSDALGGLALGAGIGCCALPVLRWTRR